MEKWKVSLFVCCIWLITNACVHESVEVLIRGPYKFDPYNTTVNWTAYKYSTKLGVSGDLPDIVFNPKVYMVEDHKDIKNILNGFEFESDPNFNVEGSTLRNQNIQNYFFNKLESKKISARVISLLGSDAAGSLDIELMFNGVTKTVEAEYTVVDNTIEVIYHLQLAEFDAIKALNILHEHVADLHTGPDGISLTWPEVDIKVTSILSRGE